MTLVAVDVKPSRRLQISILIFTSLALLALPLSAASLWLQFALGCWVMGYAGLMLRRKVPLRLSFDDGWHWHTEDSIEAVWLARATVWPLLIVLSFRNPASSRWSPAGWRRLVLLPDSVSVDDWRRLRIALRHFAVVGDKGMSTLDSL